MSGRYVPPHKRSDISSLKNGFQRELFEALRRTFVGLTNKVSAQNLRTVAVEVFRENIVRGRGLFCQAIINNQQANVGQTQVFAALVAIVNNEFPSVGHLLLRRLIGLWEKLYRRRNWSGVESINTFVGHLYCFNVCGEDLVFEIILAHLMNPKRTDEDVDLAVAVIDVVFRVMVGRNSSEFRTNLFEPLRNLLCDGQLSPRSSSVVEGALQRIREWEKQRKSTAALPKELLDICEGGTCAHYLELDGHYDEEHNLDSFVFDEHFDDHEDEYDKARKAILGEHWEDELLASAEETLGEQAVEEQGETHALLEDDKRLVKELVHMIIRSSVRADEMAHKILRAVPQGNEETTAAMIVDSCCHERTYKKAYALLSERLCKTSASFQLAFVGTFHKKYDNASQLSEENIVHVGMMWAHLLRTDSIRWNCLAKLQLLSEEPSCRLLIQALLRPLEEAAGAALVEQRLSDPELEVHLRGLLPREPSTLHLCVNIYEKMNVRSCATMMKAAFREYQRPQKRERE